MAHHHSNGGSGGSLRGMVGGEYSGDERSGGDEPQRSDTDLQDKPTYLLEHLATFTVNKDSGIVCPADGMRRLLQLEKTQGIWSQKMQLCLDYQWVLIMDYETGNIIERFPATLIQEPTAFTSTDSMELYNNILVFIVSGGSGARSEMHIFQNVSAVHLVEDLKNLRSGKMVTQQREMMQQQQQAGTSGGIIKSMKYEHHHHHQHHQHQQQHQQQYQHHRNTIDQYGIRGGMGLVADINHGGGTNNETDSEHGGGANDETSSTSSDKYERDVTVLNHCFDDIEKFIARLQHAAAASRELERRRRNRKTKKKDPGEGLLTLRTRPPHEKEFIDIFAKFKLSFNLLAKLKAHIHDPNAPELVHFLFTPLALIVEASSDTYYESQLPSRVVNPLLTREAVNLLINCVTSKETELWRSLGDAWIIPRDQWKEDVGSYHPVFLDGWSPDYLVIDELEQPTTPTNMNKRRQQLEHSHTHGINVNGNRGVYMGGTPAGASVGGNYDDYDVSEKYTIHHAHDRSERIGGPTGSAAGDFGTRSEISIDSIERGGVANPGGPSSSGNPNAAVMQSITSGLQNLHTRESKTGAGGVYGNGGNGATAGSADLVGNSMRGASANAIVGSDDQMLEAWLEDLQAAGAKIVLVTYPRTANNDKELSVMRGEYLEIIDDTRKWWKARNIRGQVAHVPHTIVTPYNYGDNDANSLFYGQQHQNNYKSSKLQQTNINAVDNSEQRSTDTTDWIRNKHLVSNKVYMNFMLSQEDANTTVDGIPLSQDQTPTTGVAIQEELKHVLRMRERRADLEMQVHKTPAIYIEQNSSPADVTNWLIAKEFSAAVVHSLRNLSGEEIFAMSKERMEEVFGPKEGRRLASQIKLQKSVSGYKTARSSELQAVLARARPRTDL